jgi:hypothetical protein
MKPSEVRDRIASEHVAMRARLDALDETLRELRQGEASWQAAVVQCQALHDALLAHLELEDAVLVPALRDIDAWGPVRADTLVRHHRMQREELRFVLKYEANSQGDTLALAARIAHLLDDLRTDMAHEDREILSRDLLRDDVIAIDLEDG